MANSIYYNNSKLLKVLRELLDEKMDTIIHNDIECIKLLKIEENNDEDDSRNDKLHEKNR